MSEIEIVDSQVHVWSADSVRQQWRQHCRGSLPKASPHASPSIISEMTPELLLKAMRLAGVNSAVLVSSFKIYGYDSSYAFAAANQYPTRFRVVTPVDPTTPDVTEVVNSLRLRSGWIGARLLFNPGMPSLDSKTYRPFFTAAEAAALPVCIHAPDALGTLASVARIYPDLQIILDHLGMRTTGDPSWGALPTLLSLSRLPNVAIKASAVPVHSMCAFPFPDLWPALDRIIAAFGVDRIIWGSDWTRVSCCNYSEGVDYIRESGRLSRDEKRQILGANLRRLFRWSEQD